MRKEFKLLSDKSLEMVSGGSLRDCLKGAMYSVLGAAVMAEGYTIMDDLSAESKDLRSARNNRVEAVSNFSSRLKPGLARTVDVAGNAALDLHNDLIDALRRPSGIVEPVAASQKSSFKSPDCMA